MVADEKLEARYFERMAASLNDKARLLEWLPPVTADYSPHILDVGAGGGELSHVLSEMGYTVTALDTNQDALDRIGETYPNVKLLNSLANHVHDFGVEFDAIICSSILHEVYSYGDDVHRMGHISSLGRALTSFAVALKPGGRLLVRDGVRPDDWADFGTVTINPDYPESVVCDYLKTCPFANGAAYGNNGFLIGLSRIGDRTFAGTNRSIMEFIFTFNWGVDSYHREAKEVYGVLCLDEYAEYVEEFGFTTLHKESYTLDGYIKGLAPKVTIKDADGNVRPMFPTNAIWIYEKIA